MNGFIKIIFFLIIGFGFNIKINSQGLTFTQSQELVLTKLGDTLTSAWAGGINSAQISTIDLNFDQIEDVVVFDKSGDKILPFINFKQKLKTYNI